MRDLEKSTPAEELAPAREDSALTVNGSRDLKVDRNTAAGLLAVCPQAIILLGPDWKVKYANEEGARIADTSLEAILNETFWSLFPLLIDTQFDHHVRLALQEQVATIIEQEFVAGRWLEIQVQPYQSGLAFFCRDVTKAKVEERALQERDADLSDFLENANVALHWVGPDGTILWANETELRFLGFRAEEYIGHNITEFHVDQPVIQDILKRLGENQVLHDYEARLRCKDGSIRDVAINSSVYRKNGKFIHTRCFTRDLSAAEDAVVLKERLAAIVESSDDAVISKDLGGVIRSWNRGAERLFGYTAQEAIGQPVSMLAAPDRRDEIPNILERIMKGERIDHYETKRRAKDGRTLSISLTVSPIRDSSGAVVGASKVARDISTERHYAELREHLASIVDSSDDAIISKDLNGIIRSWNRGAERLFGYTADEAIGQPISMLAATDRLDEIPNILGRIAKGERIEHYHTLRRAKSGRILSISLTVSPIRDAFGIVVGASKVARDITEQVRSEEALRTANESLRRSNSDLEQFAYSASHDLQEPLRMVSTYGEMLQRKFAGELGRDGDEYIGYMVEGAGRMEQLLRNLRVFTQVSVTAQEPSKDTDADEILVRTLVTLKSTIDKSGTSITHERLPVVCIYEFQLEQLFQNLIGNAIRYHSELPPKVHIAAERFGATWTFSVQDNGIGIDPKYKEHIFGLFKRLHTTADYPGTGMGLAICERIVQRAGGRIWVESELGRGSTFFFTIPAGQDRLRAKSDGPARADDSAG